MVEATIDGRGHIRASKIDPEAVKQGDVEMLEDLVLAAVAEAQKRAAEMYQAEIRKVASGLPIPVSVAVLGLRVRHRGARGGAGQASPASGVRLPTTHVPLAEAACGAAERLAELIQRVRGQVRGVWAAATSRTRIRARSAATRDAMPRCCAWWRVGDVMPSSAPAAIGAAIRAGRPDIAPGWHRAG